MLKLFVCGFLAWSLFISPGVCKVAQARPQHEYKIKETRWGGSILTGRLLSSVVMDAIWLTLHHGGSNHVLWWTGRQGRSTTQSLKTPLLFSADGNHVVYAAQHGKRW